MHAAALEFDLHIPEARSLKAKRSVVKPIVEGLQRRYRVAAAEVGYLQQWQRSEIGVAAVAATAGHVGDILDEVERFVWSHPEVQVLSSQRSWMDDGET
ncbi:MAG: DUF503 domain-containing protein [Acidimicrobiia bacterium]|nr:DUF503 domain-containing protein [Acidimicrobiia bacterium]MDQ3463018.1 DUF503 domain-containing protein [Actinomycetota bacterium]